MNLNDQHNKPIKDLVESATVSRKEYDYQINARMMSLRVMARALACLEQNHQHHIDYDEHDGYAGSAMSEDNITAIRLLKTAIGL